MHPRLFAEVRAAALLDDWGEEKNKIEALDEVGLYELNPVAP
jgi:hypothetical protein